MEFRPESNSVPNRMTKTRVRTYIYRLRRGRGLQITPLTPLGTPLITPLTPLVTPLTPLVTPLTPLACYNM